MGLGMDLVDLASFRELYGQVDTNLDRIFSPSEIADAGQTDERWKHLAGRFAAKEAALKALGCGLQDGISLTDIVVVRSQTGAPSLEISGGALAEACKLGIDSWLLSISYLETVAAAAVVLAFSRGPRKVIRRASRSA
jgi:phosphopantetheine--protein transferase-like protein